VCNEHLPIPGFICLWDHTKSPCKFCKFPLYKDENYCSNFHDINDPLCEICHMPKSSDLDHFHDDSLCKKCDTLLVNGKCIYRCVNGGKLCIECRDENVVNNVCRGCNKEQNGFLTKAAIK